MSVFNDRYYNVKAVLIWHVKCERFNCHSKEVGECKIDATVRTPVFRKPEGWFDFNGNLFCPKHSVYIRDNE